MRSELLAFSVQLELCRAPRRHLLNADDGTSEGKLLPSRSLENSLFLLTVKTRGKRQTCPYSRLSLGDSGETPGGPL